MLGIDARDRVADGQPLSGRFLGLDAITGAIAPGLRADLVLLDDQMTVQRTWIAGMECLKQTFAGSDIEI